MNELLSALGGGFFGLAASGLAFWQWRRSHNHAVRADYRAARQETLRKCWETLNEIETRQRTESVIPSKSGDAERHTQSMRQVNLLLMESAPFLRDDEREWCAEMVASMIEIDTIMRGVYGPVNGVEGTRGWQRYLMTAPQPAAGSVAARAAQRLVDLRELLAGRYAAVTRGDHD